MMESDPPAPPTGGRTGPAQSCRKETQKRNNAQHGAEACAVVDRSLGWPPAYTCVCACQNASPLPAPRPLPCFNGPLSRCGGDHGSLPAIDTSRRRVGTPPHPFRGALGTIARRHDASAAAPPRALARPHLLPATRYNAYFDTRRSKPEEGNKDNDAPTSGQSRRAHPWWGD